MPPGSARAIIWAFLLAGLGGVASCVPGEPSPAEAVEGEGFSVSLAWDAPSEDAAGAPLTDLAGYRLYYGTSTPVGAANALAVDLGPVATHTLAGLAAGRWYFAVSAMDASGNESDLSGEVSVELGPP